MFLKELWHVLLLLIWAQNMTGLKWCNGISESVSLWVISHQRFIVLESFTLPYPMTYTCESLEKRLDPCLVLYKGYTRVNFYLSQCFLLNLPRWYIEWPKLQAAYLQAVGNHQIYNDQGQTNVRRLVGATSKHESRHVAHVSKALRWRVDQLLKCLIEKITLSWKWRTLCLDPSLTSQHVVINQVVIFILKSKLGRA